MKWQYIYGALIKLNIIAKNYDWIIERKKIGYRSW